MLHKQAVENLSIRFAFSEKELTRPELVKVVKNLFGILTSSIELHEQETQVLTDLYVERCTRVESENKKLQEIIKRLNEECQALAELSVEVFN